MTDQNKQDLAALVQWPWYVIHTANGFEVQNGESVTIASALSYSECSSIAGAHNQSLVDYSVAMRARVAELEAEVARLAAPRPMGEAPRDESDVIGLRRNRVALNVYWDSSLNTWFDHNGHGYEDSDFCGWFPLPAPAPEDRAE